MLANQLWGGAEGHSSLGGKKIMIKLDMFSCLFLGCKLQQVDVFGFDLPKMVLWECSPNYSLQFLFQFAAFFLGTEVAGGAYFKNAERRTESCLMEAHTHKYIK